MANHSVDFGNKSQQQIASVASIIGGVVGALFCYDNGPNIFVGLLVLGALSFVLALISRWLGVLICLLGGLIIFGYFTGA